jgi:hypothetical protein
MYGRVPTLSRWGKRKAPLGAGQGLIFLPIPFDPEPAAGVPRCSLLERWPRWWGVAIYFRTVIVSNTAGGDPRLRAAR